MIHFSLLPVRPLAGMAVAAAVLAFALAAVPARAADAAPDEVLVENVYARVTRGDFEAEMLRIPEDKRAAFRADPKRVVGVVNNLLIVRSTAAMARSKGLDKDPVIATRMALEAERALGQAELARVEAAAAAEFDGRDAQAIEAMARELYAADAEKYKQAAEISASHILIDTKKRDAAAALALANEIRRRLLSGEDFAAVAKAASDDPSAKSNGGALGYFRAERMDPAFSQAAFALQKEGELSEPVLSSFGYHIIRLDGRRPATVLPFDQVKAGILKDARQRFIDSRRDEVLTKIAQDPAMKINNAAIESLVNRVPLRPDAAPGAAPARATGTR